MITTVLPTFVEMFEVMNAELPRPTQLLMGLSQTLINGWPTLLLILVGSAIVFAFLKEIPAVATTTDRIRIKLPLTGNS